jgi:hypothetical protein
MSVGPYGATADFVVGVTVPSGVAPGVVDTMTVSAAAGGSPNDTVRDVTTVSNLAVYRDSVYSAPEHLFLPGQTVYAHGMGLGAYASVLFYWYDTGNVLRRTSPATPVDSRGFAPDDYSPSTAATPGEWTVVMRTIGGVEIARMPFYVGYDARIDALYATDAPTVAGTVTINASAVNSGPATITASTVTYILWYDANGSGVFDAGDTYMDAGGAPHVWNGSSSVSSHVTTGVAVAPGGTWSATPWSMNNVGFPVKGTYNVTATWTSSDGHAIDARTTQFYSIPALGWPLFVLTVLSGAVLMGLRLPASRLIAKPAWGGAT